ncbi:MAG: cytidine deaminase [Flavobacteriaceae bacterium]|nr:cytidine deaminase [Flavobacteriaceae bacterium]
MKKIEISTPLTIYDSVEELPVDVQLLVQKSVEARKTAYAPYSNFNVGAALMLENGKIIIGSNQENAAYPSGICAERVAIWKAASDFPNVKVVKLVITASSNNKIVDSPVSPCGACRQTLFEYESKQDELIEIYFMGETGKIFKTDSLKDLLPIAFIKTLL